MMRSQSPGQNTVSHPAGALLHSARLYDAMVWLTFRGHERSFRQGLLDLARLQPGESLLDVGCGTGTLAILAKATVGPTGTVCGIDASPEMIARARSKAAKAAAAVQFDNGAAQALPFGDSSFDVALATLMLHHLGRAARRDLVAELARVVKPGGRVLIVDFARAAAESSRLRTHFRHRHGHVELSEITGLLDEAGFQCVESGPVGVKNMQFALATRTSLIQEI